MSHTKLGLNLSFGPADSINMPHIDELLDLLSPTNEDVWLLTLITSETADRPVKILQDLAAAGLKQAITLDHMMQFMACCLLVAPASHFRELFEFVLATNSGPFPPTSELLYGLSHMELFWALVVTKLPRSTMEFVVKRIGVPQISTFALLSSVVYRSNFDPKIMKLFPDMPAAVLSVAEAVAFFGQVSSVEILDWLIDYLSDGKPGARLARFIPNATWCSLMLQYYQDMKFSLFRRLLRHFDGGPDALYSFAQEEDFDKFACLCADLKDLPRLKRGVECTGIERISPASRARVLMYCCQAKNLDMVNYWMKVILQGPEPDFTTPVHPPDISDRPLLTIVNLAFSDHFPEFRHFLEGFKDIMTSQISRDPHLSDLIRSLVEIARKLELDQIFHPLESSVRSFKSFKRFFGDIIRRCSSEGHCPSAMLVPHLFATEGVVRDLFNVAYQWDFSAENAKHYAKCSSELIRQTAAQWNFYSRSEQIYFVGLVKLCIDCIMEETVTTKLDSGLTMLEFLLQSPFAGYLADLDPLVEKLVRLGGRISDSPSCVEALDPQAVEIYCDTLRRLEKLR
jgi:hypothetical protein